MSIARHHAEWLSLVETSGPFLSMPILARVFPQGLDAHDTDHARTLRLARDEWETSQEGSHPETALHAAWIRFVLTETLELPDDRLVEGQAIPPSLRTSVPEHGETLSPDIALLDPGNGAGAGRPRLLIQVYPRGQDLKRSVSSARWKVSPETRMVELLRGTDTRLGLATNGEQWMLVSVRPGEPAGFASWYASLWLEEPITLRAFASLLGARRFFGVAEAETLEVLLAESAADQQEVTDQLGWQVRRAVEVLVAALDRADRDHGGALLRGVPETRLYEAAVTVMMRLVFLFAAEERGLLLLGDPLYDEHYAVSTLRAQLRETADEHGEEVLQHRIDAWCRLLSTFRTVHGGVRHDRLTLPAYGGSLFDPDRFPFLEGRTGSTSWRETPASPVPINNRSPSSTSWTPSRSCRCGYPAADPPRPAASASARSTSSRSGTSTRACWTTPRCAPARPSSASTGRARRSPKPPWTISNACRPTGTKSSSSSSPKRPVDSPRQSGGRLPTSRWVRTSTASPSRARTTSASSAVCARSRSRPRGPARLPRGHPGGQRLRHARKRPPLDGHPLHAPEPHGAHRPLHAGAARLRRPRRRHAARRLAPALRR